MLIISLKDIKNKLHILSYLIFTNTPNLLGVSTTSKYIDDDIPLGIYDSTSGQ